MPFYHKHKDSGCAIVEPWNQVVLMSGCESQSCGGVATFCVWCMLRCAGVREEYGLSK